MVGGPALKVSCTPEGMGGAVKPLLAVRPDSCRVPALEVPMAAFTGLSFLQLLTGYRMLAELEYAAQDTWASPTARVLLNVLFPKQPSHMHPVL